ncbi:MAG TPA: hypothetical protein VMH22_11985 [bacterium]|nr:hypothetical protein [bacterium]
MADNDQKSWVESIPREELTKLLKSTEKSGYESGGVSMFGAAFQFASAEGVADNESDVGTGGVVGPKSLSEIDEDCEPELRKAFVAKGLGPETKAYYFTYYDKAEADDYTIETDSDAAEKAFVDAFIAFCWPQWQPWEDQDDETLRFWAERLCEQPTKPAASTSSAKPKTKRRGK